MNLTELRSADTFQGFHWDVPDGWQQGRGAFGGLVFSALVQSLKRTYGEGDQKLRSLTAALCAPVLPERADIEVALLRRGSGTTTLRTTLTQGGEVRAEATGIFGRRRVEDVDWNEMQAPQAVPWRQADTAPVGAPAGPVFAKNFEFRVLSGIPFSGAKTRESVGWIRARERTRTPAEEELALLIDTWWPAYMSAIPAPRPMGTIAFTMQFYSDWEGLDPDAPLLYRGTSPTGNGGYCLDLRELWAEDGRLLALNQQTICVIK